MKALQAVAFTAKGAALCNQICTARCDAEGYAPARYCVGALHPLEEKLTDWTGARFHAGGVLLFIGAAGIAVRAVAPYVQHKTTDPAVIVLDEKGQWVIPLLSGHIGGANRLAREVAEQLGAQPILTTATDVNGVFSPDAWAAENGYAVANPESIRDISSCLLDGEPVGLSSTYPVRGALPAGIVVSDSTRCGIEIGLHARFPFVHTLHLIPRILIAGIGCRRDTPHARIRQQLEAVLLQHALPLQAVGTLASIDLKANEIGLLSFAQEIRAPLVCFSAGELAATEGVFTPSARVQRITGVDNVCERAAVLAGGTLLSYKHAENGVTIALAVRPWQIFF